MSEVANAHEEETLGVVPDIWEGLEMRRRMANDEMKWVLSIQRHKFMNEQGYLFVGVFTCIGEY